MDACCKLRGNVSASQRDRRLRVGVGLFAVSLLAGVLMVKAGISPAYRLVLIVPFWMAAQSFFSALHGTCGYMAKRGLRHTGEGTERIIDKEELAAIRLAGMRVMRQGTFAAVFFTAVMTFGA